VDGLTIEATFKKPTYKITATADEDGGSISPSGVVPVDCGGSQEFFITTDQCYVADVLVDGTSLDFATVKYEQYEQ